MGMWGEGGRKKGERSLPGHALFLVNLVRYITASSQAICLSFRWDAGGGGRRGSWCMMQDPGRREERLDELRLGDEER